MTKKAFKSRDLTGITLFKFLLLVMPTSAFSEATEPSQPHQENLASWTGQISIVGSQFSARTVLRNSGTNESQRICAGELSQQISQLAGMTLTIQGQLQEGSTARRNCLNATSFTIDKTTTGRPAAVGRLDRDETGFYLYSDGTQMRLNRLLPGMEQLVGKQVILSVDNQATLSDNSIQPMSYMAFPK